MKVFNTRSYVWLIYAILWGMVWAYPVLTTLVIAVRGGTTPFLEQRSSRLGGHTSLLPALSAPSLAGTLLVHAPPCTSLYTFCSRGALSLRLFPLLFGRGEVSCIAYAGTLYVTP